jgi:hypothetical protein
MLNEPSECYRRDAQLGCGDQVQCRNQIVGNLSNSSAHVDQ